MKYGGIYWQRRQIGENIDRMKDRRDYLGECREKWKRDYRELHKEDLEKEEGVVYMLVNDVNRQMYVGETKGRAMDRMEQHFKDYRRNQKPTYKRMRRT